MIISYTQLQKWLCYLFICRFLSISVVICQFRNQQVLARNYQMDGKRCGVLVSEKFLRCAATQKLLRRSIDNGPTSLSRSCLYDISVTLISLHRVSSQLPIQRLLEGNRGMCCQNRRKREGESDNSILCVIGRHKMSSHVDFQRNSFCRWGCSSPRHCLGFSVDRKP